MFFFRKERRFLSSTDSTDCYEFPISTSSCSEEGCTCHEGNSLCGSLTGKLSGSSLGSDKDIIHNKAMENDNENYWFTRSNGKKDVIGSSGSTETVDCNEKQFLNTSSKPICILGKLIHYLQF